MESNLNFPITYLPKPPVNIDYEDNVIRSKMEDGYVHTRPRSTKARRKYSMKWDGRNKEYKDVDYFYRVTTVNGSKSFNLNFKATATDSSPKNAEVVFFAEVIFTSPPKFSYEGMGVWTISCEFVEV